VVSCILPTSPSFRSRFLINQLRTNVQILSIVENAIDEQVASGDGRGITWPNAWKMYTRTVCIIGQTRYMSTCKHIDDVKEFSSEFWEQLECKQKRFNQSIMRCASISLLTTSLLSCLYLRPCLQQGQRAPAGKRSLERVPVPCRHKV
jgi:hypothetical protein